MGQEVALGHRDATIRFPRPTMADVYVHRTSRPIVSRDCFARFRSEVMNGRRDLGGSADTVAADTFMRPEH